jgi:hypothetical protein
MSGPGDSPPQTCPPPVTVVMPTRNQAAFIERAIASVWAQGVDGLELCVQDGDSSDGTQALLAALAARHPALRWVSEPDGGPAEAVNRAVARARGAIIGWLNSDDLYTPGAVARALAHLARHPQHVMVYGQGEHIDVQGKVTGRYPTRAPATPLAAWADACHICQPTAFFRREAFVALGGLDTTLHTAFDYEFWLRLLKAHGAGAVGMLPEVQAQSRLHPGAITSRLREQVALESMALLHRHLGQAPSHWLVTHVGEALAACPFDAEPAAVQRHLLGLANRAAPWLGPGGAQDLQRQMRDCRAWQLLQPHFATNVHADGWAGPELELRLRQPPAPLAQVGRLRLHGRHAWPRPGRLRLRLTVWLDGQQVASQTVWWRRPFVLDIPVARREGGAKLLFQVRASDDFVPATSVAGSHDRRRLAFLVEAVDTLPAT